MGRVKWTEKASSHIQSIQEYISRDSKVYALRYIKSLVKAAEKLEMMPFCGRIVPEFESEDFREIIFRNHRIIYRVIGDREDVEVLAVIHGARDLVKLFPEQ
ncbi:MAG: type II toxin-antitoxin system RelE/ParE family toxin [Candidatus Aminicenantes bacterium]|nr:type II toxin-antitoxin system RelE/ParE family toxin [Candidatus Aminicenantes bacterium]